MSIEGTQAPEFGLESTGGGTVPLSGTLDTGPAVVLVDRGRWCSLCGEQPRTSSEVSWDLWFNDGVDVLPVVTDPLRELTGMRDRCGPEIQLLADPDAS